MSRQIYGDSKIKVKKCGFLEIERIMKPMKQTKTIKPMTKEQILVKAVEKAVKNGYRLDTTPARLVENLDIFGGRTCQWVVLGIVLSHDFAKAFWKDEESEEGYATTRGKHGEVPMYAVVRPWQWHLTQMVLEPDPIRYLEQFI